MRRPQFSIRALLVVMLVVAAFFGGIKFEQERRLREEQAAQVPAGRVIKVRMTYKPLVSP